MKFMDFPAWAEIDLKALAHNFRAVRDLARRQFANGPVSSRIPVTKRHCPELLAVVKAEAYGHGMWPIVKRLDKLGIDFFGVSDVAEGVFLRWQGIKRPILLFESTLPRSIQPVVNYNLIPTICTLDYAQKLNRYAKSRRKRIDVHVKVDTGMGRLGVVYGEARSFIDQLMRLPNLSVKGIYTHFPLADTNPAFTKKQVERLSALIKGLDRTAQIIPYVHASNSVGLGYKTNIFNLVRPGLMFYGLYPAPTLRKLVDLKPVMSVKAKVIFIKHIKPGQGVSYGHTFVARKNMTVATIPLGYSDGYLRCFSNKSSVLIQGRRCPVVGRVTMDQIMVDVSRLKNVHIGMEAVIMGKQSKEEVSADELARLAGTINYEIVCNLGNRLPRVYKR